MTYIPEALRRQIAVRANFHCEYCLTGQINRTKPHEVDHIYAEKHGGATVAENLCLSCYYCNRYKGSDLCGLDPETGVGAAKTLRDAMTSDSSATWASGAEEK